MILAKFIDNGVTQFASMGGINPNLFWFRNWKNFIKDFTAPQYRMSESFGGHVFCTFGKIVFSPDLQFTDLSIPVEIYYTATNDEILIPVFLGTMQKSEITPESVTFDLYDYEEECYLLDEAENYDGDTVILPRAFGWCRHVPLVRLPDHTVGVTDYPCYHNGYIAGTLGADWHVFDDGVDICSGATDLGDDTFWLDAVPVGEVTATGFGDYTDIEEILAWACGSTKLNYQINMSLIRTVGTGTFSDIRMWADSQEKMIDFVNRMAAMCTHMTFIQ